MKKMMITLTALLMIAVSAQAMSYEQAREQALFLTDKMAYELNLNDAQYEAAYEVNLDYLMSVATQDDLYGAYWRQRNIDLSYILFDWQYRTYCAASYFYRPLYWSAGLWHFGIYARYPHRNYFYFHRPAVYLSYRGGHNWHHNGGRSWYHGRDFGPRDHNRHVGMRDSYHHGDHGRATSHGSGHSLGSRYSQGSGHSQGNGHFGSQRGSSTRTTVTRPSSGKSLNTTGSRRPSDTFTPHTGSRSSGSSSSDRSYGGGSGSFSHSYGGSTSRSSAGRSQSGASSHGNSSHGSGRSHSGGHFGGRR